MLGPADRALEREADDAVAPHVCGTAAIRYAGWRWADRASSRRARRG